MNKIDSTGVYQLDNGYWAYRFKIVVDGQEISSRRTADEEGNKFRTKREASKARDQAIAILKVGRVLNDNRPRKTIEQIYKEYREKGSGGKAYQTLRKQDSLWDNHLKEDFGRRFVESIKTAEINDYLTDLYYEREYSFMYTESFLKMFYLIFGQAYSRGYLSHDDYNRLCINKDTKIRMPKQKRDDDIDIVAFSEEELAILDEYFHGTNAETAYLLGRYCGLRINECFGLKWANVDLKHGTILIDRQMQYQEGLIKLVPPKTRNAKRTIYLCDNMKKYLIDLKRRRNSEKEQYAALIEQRRRVIDDLDGGKTASTELVNCLPDGTIQTVNSMKYPTREIKAKFGIEFKYHYLRHTYGTRMAEMNTPAHLLCSQMGHGNIQVTQKYYLAVSATGIAALNENPNRL